MRSADHHAGAVVACRIPGRRGNERVAADQLQPCLMLQRIGQAQQVLIGEHPAEQCHAPGQAVSHDAGRHRDGGVVEHVHEVGVVAQVRIALDRLGVKFGERHWARVGGRQHTIDLGHGAVADGLELLQAVLRLEQLHGGCTGGFLQNGLYYRQHGVGLLLDQRARHAVAFGDPGAFVEQACSFQKGLEVNLHRLAAEGFQMLDCGGEQRRAFGAAEKFQLLGYAEAEGLDLAEGRAVIPQRVAAAVLVARIEPGGERQQLTGFGRRRGEEGHAVQRTAGRDNAGGGDQPFAGLQTHQVVQCRRHAAGTGGIGAQREACQPQRHGQRGASAGAAGGVVRVHRVAAFAIGRAGAIEAGGELVEVGLAQRHRAEGEQLLDDRRAGFGRVGERRAGGGGGHACEIDVVLDGEGHAIERQLGGRLAVEGGEIRLELRGRHQVDECVELRAEFRSLVAQAKDQLARGDVPGGVGGAQGGEAQVECRGHLMSLVR